MGKLPVFVFSVSAGVILIALLPFLAAQGEVSFNQSLNCSQQLHPAGKQIHQCQVYLFTGSRYELPVISPYSILQQRRFRDCCKGLQILDRQCRCDAVKVVVQGLQHQMQQGHGQRIEAFEVKVERAKDLPRACNLDSHQC